MRIQCPHCQAAIEIGQPKPGRYRPKCKHCGEPFVVAVSDDQPAKVRVGRDERSEPKPTREATVPSGADQAKRPGAKPAERPASSPSQKTAAADIEATVDAQPMAKTRVSVVEETVAAVVDVAQTKDSPSGSSAASFVVAKSKAPFTSKAGGESIVRAKPTAKPEASESQMPAKLGGYRLIRMLGQGAMGAVYEAKQVSLDRTVALKTIRDRLVNKPSALARFTREAYAAAQLNHHNVVQIYDFGEDAGQHFFSMERVDGAPLNEVIREQGPLDPKLAATYVLQAARGLQFAHRSGMVHRDVKPANLLLRRDGVVKVADLGLVKIPDQQDVPTDGDSESLISRASGTQVTMMGSAVGTPAYMAPEQSIDATQVDHRADIYSLGCTLYYLLVGKPPFDGSDVSALQVQHASAPIPEARAAVACIPAQLDTIIGKAMAKRVDDRYPTLAGMINDLESFLGIKSGDGFSPTVADANAWSQMAAEFERAAPKARLRPTITFGFVALCAVLFALTPWIGFGWILMGPTCLLLGVATASILQATQDESAILVALRRLLGSWGIVDWVYAIAVIALVLVIALFAGGWPGLLVGICLGATCGTAYHFGLLRPIHSARAPMLESAEQMLRTFRISGADEDEVRQFVARNSGRSWPELFEALFGFDNMLAMRQRAKEDPMVKKPQTSLRDRLAAKLIERANKNRETRDQLKLSKIEQRALVSEGVSEAEARDRAWQMAAALMDATKIPPAEDTVAVAAQAKRQRIKAMMADARSGRYAKSRDRFGWLKTLVGAQLRLALGVGLLAIVAIWVHRSGLIDRESIQAMATQIQSGDVNLQEMGGTLRDSVQNAGSESGLTTATILGLPVLSIGLAGLMLVASSLGGSWLMTPLALLAAATAIAGPAFGIPPIGPIPAYALSALAGMAILLTGIFLIRQTES